MKRAETCSWSLCNKLYISLPPYSCVRQVYTLQSSLISQVSVYPSTVMSHTAWSEHHWHHRLSLSHNTKQFWGEHVKVINYWTQQQWSLTAIVETHAYTQTCAWVHKFAHTCTMHAFTHTELAWGVYIHSCRICYNELKTHFQHMTHEADNTRQQWCLLCTRSATLDSSLVKRDGIHLPQI